MRMSILKGTRRGRSSRYLRHYNTMRTEIILHMSVAIIKSSNLEGSRKFRQLTAEIIFAKKVITFYKKFRQKLNILL